MKATIFTFLFVVNPLCQTTLAQTATDVSGKDSPRITFMLKNTLGYHRMFRVEGPGIAYGFTMDKRETIPCHWPAGSQLYFSRDGETTTGLILTVAATDAGKTLTTDTGATETRTNRPVTYTSVTKRTVVIRLRNTSWLPKKVTLISYEPGETGNSTRIFVMNPKGTTSVRFLVGTKLYMASNEQVDVVMSGKRIDNDKPFLTVKAEDKGRLLDVN